MLIYSVWTDLLNFNLTNCIRHKRLIKAEHHRHLMWRGTLICFWAPPAGEASSLEPENTVFGTDAARNHIFIEKPDYWFWILIKIFITGIKSSVKSLHVLMSDLWPLWAAHSWRLFSIISVLISSPFSSSSTSDQEECGVQLLKQIHIQVNPAEREENAQRREPDENPKNLSAEIQRSQTGRRRRRISLFIINSCIL